MVQLFFIVSSDYICNTLNISFNKGGISIAMKKLIWLDILIIILFILSVYFILTRIFGHSASDLTIMISLFSLIGSFVIRLTFFVAGFNREFGEFKVKTIHGFERVKEDMNLIKEDLGLIKNKLKI